MQSFSLVNKCFASPHHHSQEPAWGWRLMMMFGEWALTLCQLNKQTEVRVRSLQSTLAAGASLMPVGKGYFLGRQAGCAGGAVPCFVSYLVRLAGDFFCTQTATPDSLCCLP